MATPNSMNTTGPTAGTGPNDPTGQSSSMQQPMQQPTEPMATPQAAPSTTDQSMQSGQTQTTTTTGSRLYTTTTTNESGVTMQVVSNGPVADTPENRQRFGGPMSRAGRRTSAKGN
jgi:hypothetical protein